jgi:hypothetical protein
MACDQGFENLMCISLGHIFGRFTHVSNDREKEQFMIFCGQGWGLMTMTKRNPHDCLKHVVMGHDVEHV